MFVCKEWNMWLLQVHLWLFVLAHLFSPLTTWHLATGIKGFSEKKLSQLGKIPFSCKKKKKVPGRVWRRSQTNIKAKLLCKRKCDALTLPFPTFWRRREKSVKQTLITTTYREKGQLDKMAMPVFLFFLSFWGLNWGPLHIGQVLNTWALPLAPMSLDLKNLNVYLPRLSGKL